MATSPNRAIATPEPTIHLIRGQRMVLDSNLAAVYGTSTMRLNEQFRRNRQRFLEDFAFVLTRTAPAVFTEHGAIRNSQPAIS